MFCVPCVLGIIIMINNNRNKFICMACLPRSMETCLSDATVSSMLAWSPWERPHPHLHSLFTWLTLNDMLGLFCALFHSFWSISILLVTLLLVFFCSYLSIIFLFSNLCLFLDMSFCWLSYTDFSLIDFLQLIYQGKSYTMNPDMAHNQDRLATLECIYLIHNLVISIYECSWT